MEAETATNHLGPLVMPDEPIQGKLADQVPAYGMSRFQDLFLPRQLLALLTFVEQVRVAYQEMLKCGIETNRAQSILAYLALVVDKLALRSNMFCTWATTSSGGRLTQAFGRQALEMVWDFVEANPFSDASGS